MTVLLTCGLILSLLGAWRSMEECAKGGSAAAVFAAIQMPMFWVYFLAKQA